MIEFFHCFNCFKKNTTLRKEVSFTTAFLKVNTLYTINNLVRVTFPTMVGDTRQPFSPFCSSLFSPE